MMTRSERAPWAQWRLTAQGSLFYLHTAEQHLIALTKLIWLTPGAEAKLKHASEKSPVWFGCKKTHRFRVLIKAFLVKKKGQKLQFWAGWLSLDQWPPPPETWLQTVLDEFAILEFLLCVHTAAGESVKIGPGRSNAVERLVAARRSNACLVFKGAAEQTRTSILCRLTTSRV